MSLRHQTALTLELYFETVTRDCLKDVLSYLLMKIGSSKSVYLIIGLFDENFAIVKQHHLLYLL